MDDINHMLYQVELPDGTTETEIEATASLTQEDFDRIAKDLRRLAGTVYAPDLIARLLAEGGAP